MGIENFSENVLVVDLPSEEPQIGNELKHLNETVAIKCDCDVVVDFSGVDIITSLNLSHLLTLRAFLHEQRHRLVLCGVAVLTKGIFTVAGLDAVFEFAPDRNAALVILKHSKDTPVHTPSK
jgi:anti-anti-sigma regulatory factor